MEIMGHLPKPYQLFYQLCKEVGLKIIDETDEKINFKISNGREIVNEKKETK